MKQDTKKIQRMSIYFPLDLLDKVRESAQKNKRSFNQEVLFILDREVNKEEHDKEMHDAEYHAIIEELKRLGHSPQE